jgi:hypothetical protein
MHSVLSKMKIKTGDVFLLWRIKKLSEEGKIEINGETSKSWKDFEVRVKTAIPEVVETNNPVP